jgi:hypothetical protein
MNKMYFFFRPKSRKVFVCQNSYLISFLQVTGHLVERQKMCHSSEASSLRVAISEVKWCEAAIQLTTRAPTHLRSVMPLEPFEIHLGRTANSMDKKDRRVVQMSQNAATMSVGSANDKCC